MARDRNSKKQRRKAKLKKRTPKPRSSKPYRVPEGAKVSKLGPQDDQEVRQFIRGELKRKTGAKKVGAMLQVRAAEIVGRMKLKPNQDPEGFERKILDKLQLILEEEAFANAYPVLVDHPKIQTQAHRLAVQNEAKGLSVDASKAKVDAFIRQKLEENQRRSGKKLEQLNREIARMGKRENALTDKFRRSLKKLSLPELTKLAADVDGRFGPDEVKDLRAAIAEASLGVKAAAGVKERMADGMSEQEAIDHFLNDGKANPMDDDLREMIRQGFAQGETAEQIEESLMKESLHLEPNKRSRKSGRDRIRKLIEEVGTTTANATLDEISAGMTEDEREHFMHQVVDEGEEGQQLSVERLRALADEITSKRDVSLEEIRQELKAYKLDDYGNDKMTEDRLVEAVRQLRSEERPEFYEALSHHVHNKRGQPLNLDDLVEGVKSQRGTQRAQPQFATGGAWDKYQTKKRPIPQEQSVECYMEMLTNAYKLTKSHKNAKLQREGVYLWRCLRDARVFHFDPEVYAGLHQEIDRYTTEELAGLTYRAPGTFDRKNPKSPAGESTILRATIFREAKRAPYPEKFPFPSVFIGHGGGLVQSKPFLMMSAPASLRERIEMGAIFGHLLTDDGTVIACVKAGIRDDSGQLIAAIWFDPLRHPSGWVRSEFNLEPWILPQLIKIINDHRTFILESSMSRNLRKDYKKNRKGMGIKPDKRAYTPPPYYTLRMKSKIIRQKVRKALPRPSLPRTYKTDVRAHERCRIARGTLPLDPETGAKLKKRDYKIFTTNALDLDTYRRLSERGLPYKKADEWLAIKVTWVETHMSSNDPKLPYIPAVRVPGEIHLKPKKPTGSWADNPAR